MKDKLVKAAKKLMENPTPTKVLEQANKLSAKKIVGTGFDLVKETKLLKPNLPQQRAQFSTNNTLVEQNSSKDASMQISLGKLSTLLRESTLINQTLSQHLSNHSVLHKRNFIAHQTRNSMKKEQNFSR